MENSGTRWWDVAIVGAGPTGLLLAGDLAAEGIRTVVLERAAGRSVNARANGLVGRIVPVLRGRGMFKGTGHRAVSPRRYRFGPLILDFGPVRRPLHVLPIPQRRLEELLEMRALGHGATLLRGHQVTDFEQHSTHVAAHATTTVSDIQLTARYLVGCDGAHSVLRKRLGIDFPGLTGPDISRLARVRIPGEAVSRVRDGLDIRGLGRLPMFRPTRTASGSVTIAPANALDRSAPSDLFIVSTHEPRGDVQPSDRLGVEEFRESLRRVLGAELPLTAVSDARSVVASSRQAASYRAGRVFLAGDAAHIFSAGAPPSTSACSTRSVSPRSSPPFCTARRRRASWTPMRRTGTRPAGAPSCTPGSRWLSRRPTAPGRRCAKSSVS